MKYKGYIGQKSKNRTRNKSLLSILFIVIVFFIFSYIRERNLIKSNNNIMKVKDNDIIEIEEKLPYEDQSLQLTELKTKILEYEQKIQLRNRLIESLKDQVNDLEKNNNELLESISLQDIELQNIKDGEIKNFRKTIETLKKEGKKQNNNFLLFEKKNIKLNDQIKILNDSINKLELQKNTLFKNISNLQHNIIEQKNNIIEKEKIIENLKDKIHH